ncbi:MAG: hypothetical protein J6B45_02545 [Clostridia bacterium]|nr:hypothetical protein [Clostridia bacterium]
MKKRILSLILCIVMCMSVVGVLASCGGGNTTDGSQNGTNNSQGGENNQGGTQSSNTGNNPGGNTGNQGGNSLPVDKGAFVIMSEELDGLFNPFYSTTGADSTIVSMTQIGMLTSKYVNGDIQVAFGENEAVVTKDFQSVYDEDTDTTKYTFVLKNGIKYSDGHPLTMEDVLFNLYVYLDPVYAGSATLYSTKILGLNSYRTQRIDSDTGTDSDSQLSEQAAQRASARINELVNLFRKVGKQPSGSYYADMTAMRNAINALTEVEISSGYKTAVSAKPNEISHDEWKNQLLTDYNEICRLYKEELEKAYNTALEAYTEAPYKNHAEFKDQIFCFMASQGYVEIKYVKVNGKEDRSQIESLTKQYGDQINTKEAAIDYAFNDTISGQLNIVLGYTASAQTLLNEYVSNAKDVILHEMVGDDGSLKIDSIEGIVSLGHKEGAAETVTVNGNTYKVAKEHNEDGTVKNSDEYDVLEITIEGVDPKAVWNFAFAVAPQHYYGKGSKVGVDLDSNKFGVEWGSFEFMTKIIQSPINISVPVGAGAYKATNRSNDDNPNDTDFYSNNIVYFKANNYFETVGEGLNNAKIEKVRYQVLSASNALPMLEAGNVHYITPQLTDANFTKIEDLDKRGANYILNDQLGYGYIGINASKVPDINIRRAIMCAMNTKLALDYYRTGTAQTIYWPMSTVSWAYPKDSSGNPEVNNERNYPIFSFTNEEAKDLILSYMEKAGVTAGSSSLRMTFTIAGSNVQDHPTYKVFRDAAALLNELGWQITVQADTQALTKLSTGSLTVWAAAWGSTIDPDLYQVYHKNSTATSTLAWGYPSIKTSGSREEKDLLNDLSDLIEKARETEIKEDRAEYYKEALGLILDLAIELPVYQRSVVYVYNSNVIDPNSLPDSYNPYSSPLDRIWEIEFTK